MSNAGPKTVTQQVTDQPGLAVDNLDGPFRAVGYAEPAAGTFFFINRDDVPFHVFASFVNVKKFFRFFIHKNAEF
jgi:hypothetical protein